MHKYLSLFLFALISSTTFAVDIPCIGSAAHARADIALDTAWKKTVYAFAEKALDHSAWGFAHGKRDYLLSLELAAQDGVAIDCDVMFAAAFLHDMGGFPPYEKAGVDHALRSTQVIETVLNPTDFPVSKLEAVKGAILTHSYYETMPPSSPEGIVLHDADTLDFLGAISVARILSLTRGEAARTGLPSSVRLLESLLKAAPGAIVGGAYTKQLTVQRKKEMEDFLKVLRSESFGLKAL